MRIATARLVLREFTADDWPEVLALQRDPRYLRFYAWTDRSEAEVREFVQMFVNQQADRPRRKFQLAITLPDSGRLIGDCGIRRKPGNHWEADIGYELSPEYWGRGYATEAAERALVWANRTWGRRYVVAGHFSDNPASGQVLCKLGFLYTGEVKLLTSTARGGEVPARMMVWLA